MSSEYVAASSSRTSAAACWSPAWARPWPRTSAWRRRAPADGARRASTFGTTGAARRADAGDARRTSSCRSLVEQTEGRHRPPRARRRRGAGQRPRRSAARTTTATTPSWPWPPRTRCRASCPRRSRPLPVLKVLYRNTDPHPGARAAARHEALHPVEPAAGARGQGRRRGPPRARPASRTWTRPSASSPRIAPGSLDDAYNDLQYCRRRTTSTSTASSWPGAPGPCSTSPARSTPTRCSASRSGSACNENRNGASTVGRSRRCCRSCSTSTSSPARRSAPATADDAWVEPLAQTIYGAGREKAADAVAAALAEGIAPERDRRGDLAGREPARPPRPRPARRPIGAASRRAASTATRSASTPPTRPTPGGTSPASATAATRSPA